MLHIRIPLSCCFSSVLVLTWSCGGDASGPSNQQGGDASVSTVEVTPVIDTISTVTALGVLVQFQAVAKNASGAAIAGKTFSWSSSDANAASVTATGLATTIGNGAARITATTDGVSGFFDLTVNQMVDRVEPMSPVSALMPGETTQLTVTVTDWNGSAVPNRTVTWVSEDPALATVNSGGLVTALRAGSPTITATADARNGSISIDVVVQYASISAGEVVGCGVTATADAYCWGENREGELGTGVTDDAAHPLPEAVVGGLALASVGAASASPGPYHTCGLTTGGDGYCWGDNSRGALGDGSLTLQAAPVLVAGGLTFQSITTGGLHSCGVTTGGDAYCWGANDRGEIGNGTTTDQPQPALVSGGHSFASVSAGTFFTCGVTTTGDAYCWGRNSFGQLGNGSSDENSHSVPGLVLGGHTFATVSTGVSHACGVTAAGDAYCWGSNAGGALGNPTAPGCQGSSPCTTPVLVAGGLTFASISAGRHTCGIISSDVAYCWGLNQNGEIGDGSTTSRATPTAVAGGLTFTAVSAGGFHTCGMATDGIAYCWGANSSGQLGSDTLGSNRTTPTRVRWQR